MYYIFKSKLFLLKKRQVNTEGANEKKVQVEFLRR